jgi:hypothetical protein
MQVYVIIANNPSDFDENDVWVVGITKEAAEAELQRVLQARWEKCNENAKDFYRNDAYEYEKAWRHAWALLEIAQ